MTTIKNILVIEHKIPSATYDLCKQLGVEKYLSPIIPKSMTFELHNTNTDMVNSLRRCIDSNVSVLLMDFKSSDMQSDDTFIIYHKLRKRINSIPIRQYHGMTLNLDVLNDTDVDMPVFSHNIKDTDLKKRDELLFSGSFILTNLRPGKHLVIKNITTVSGSVTTHNALYSFPGKVGFKCMDGGDSSLNTNPSIYRLTIPKQKYIEPVQIIKMAIDNLSNRLTKLHDIITETSYTPDIEIQNSIGKATYKILNETNTIGHLIVRYNPDKTIHYIQSTENYVAKYIMIEIHHADPKKIILTSINNIIKDLNNIMSAF